MKAQPTGKRPKNRTCLDVHPDTKAFHNPDAKLSAVPWLKGVRVELYGPEIWAPAGPGVTENLCERCGGHHTILNDKARYCPWCGAVLYLNKARRFPELKLASPDELRTDDDDDDAPATLPEIPSQSEHDKLMETLKEFAKIQCAYFDKVLSENKQAAAEPEPYKQSIVDTLNMLAEGLSCACGDAEKPDVGGDEAINHFARGIRLLLETEKTHESAISLLVYRLWEAGQTLPELVTGDSVKDHFARGVHKLLADIAEIEAT
ncbi:MAG: hypothetical protein SGI88_02090 [Candidatus Hydrogenedentes bacterium]|nr:hypothetical protein [Candidatus Hydrogenedentota bacterium]